MCFKDEHCQGEQTHHLNLNSCDSCKICHRPSPPVALALSVTPSWSEAFVVQACEALELHVLATLTQTMLGAC